MDQTAPITVSSRWRRCRLTQPMISAASSAATTAPPMGVIHETPCTVRSQWAQPRPASTEWAMPPAM